MAANIPERSDPMNPSPDARQLLEAQQAAFRAEAGADARLRRDRLQRAIALLVDHQVEICEALAHDFGRRPATLTRFVDILPGSPRSRTRALT
jgi:coniferyl-aldehyde dehydrogenase